MVWVQLFPLGTTFINQSVQQIQDNWLFLQNNINTDHFFNDINPNNEGHHRFVQLLDGGDPALAAGMSAVEYSKATGNVNMQQPYWRNAVGIRQIPTVITGTVAVIVGLNTMFSFAGLPRCSGFVEAHDPNNINSHAVTYYWWNGANVIVGGQLGGTAPGNFVATDIFTLPNSLGFGGVGALLTLSVAYNGNATYQINTMPY